MVTEAANAGFDTVVTSVDYALPASNTVEVLNMVGAGLTGTGSDGAESLISSGGPNTLVGLGGNDVYYASNTADVVIEAANGGIDTVVASVDYTLPASNTVEVLNMLGSGLTGTGSDGAESLISSGGPNTLVGLGGNDLLCQQHRRRGSRGCQRRLRHRGRVRRLHAAGQQHGRGLYMQGSGLTGTGSDGAESFISTGGPNTLVGLGGNDVYYVSNTADVVIEAANGGFDSVQASVSYTLPAMSRRYTRSAPG